MTTVLYDLAAADGRCFSPYCWRTKMALAHKGVRWEARPTTFSAIAAVDGEHRTLPIIDDDGVRVADSWRIAVYLDEKYPDRPALFGGRISRGLTAFVQQWVGDQLQAPLFRMIVADVHAHLAPEDRDYFRQSREKRLGRRLEDVQANRDEVLPAFRAGLGTLRATLASQPFLGGDEPAYADYIVFGALQWARMTSAFRPLAEDDPLLGWFRRCLDLHDGLARGVSAHWE